MFDPKEGENNEQFFEDLEKDLVVECEKCGPIDKITVFSTHPKGVVIIKFHTSFAAQECIRIMDGRYFGGRRLRSMFWDGVTNYSTPSAGGGAVAESKGEQSKDADEERLEEFGDWLEHEQEDLPEEFRLRVE